MESGSAKRTIIGALIITMSLIVIGISGSYAYYTTSVEQKADTDGGVSLTSGDLHMQFATNDYINANNVELIDSSKYKTEAKKSSFTISLPAEDSVVPKATYEIYLTGIKMTKNMQSKYLKWALHKNGSETATVDGTFANVTLSSSPNADGTYDVTTFSLLTNQEINKGDIDSYVLYVWLENDPNVNQSDKSGAPGAINLLEGKLEFRVGFRATT